MAWRSVARDVRAFVQVAAATDAGRHPAERPFDRTRPDIAQAFVDIPLSKGVVLRVGRQELDSGGNRLIAVREAANVRLAFDMAHLAASFARGQYSRLGLFDAGRTPVWQVRNLSHSCVRVRRGGGLAPTTPRESEDSRELRVRQWRPSGR
jgi:hypothetical protein